MQGTGLAHLFVSWQGNHLGPGELGLLLSKEATGHEVPSVFPLRAGPLAPDAPQTASLRTRAY